MLRVMMLAPFLILLAARVKQLSGANSGEKSKITIPWFAILFIVVAIFNSFHLLPQSVVNMLVTLDTFLLAMAMAALGLTTHVSALKKKKSWGETSADGTGTVCLADCWWWCD